MPQRTYTEEEVQDLTDRVFLLQEKLSEGKIHIAEHLVDGFRESLAAIRINVNGLVDPATVNGRIRAMTLALKAFRYREELKDSYSQAEIQSSYFQFLEMQFGRFFEQMKKAGANPYVAGEVLARDDNFVSHTLNVLPELIEEVREFWNNVAEIGAIHLEDGRQLKATFAGDIFPGYWENAVSTAGLYVDTIVLPCPIMRLAAVVRFERTRETVAMFFKHVFTAMTYKHLATADIDPPIVLVLPGERDLDPEALNLIELAKPLALKHGQYLFGRGFESFEDLGDFLYELPEVDDVLRELKKGDRLLFDLDMPRDPRVQLEEVLKRGDPLPPGFDRRHAGMQVLNSCVGRMPQALDARLKAARLGGTPLIMAPTSWEYFSWMLEYGAEGAGGGVGDASSHIVHALASPGESLEWLGNVPPETILEIRKRGQAQEIREILGRGVESLVKINSKNYKRTADQVAANLDRAFEKHLTALRKARAEKLRFYGIDVGSCTAVGAIAVAAAITANPILGVVSGALGIAGAPSLREIRSKYEKLKQEEADRLKTPAGLLFQHRKMG